MIGTEARESGRREADETGSAPGGSCTGEGSSGMILREIAAGGASDRGTWTLPEIE